MIATGLWPAPNAVGSPKAGVAAPAVVVLSRTLTPPSEVAAARSGRPSPFRSAAVNPVGAGASKEVEPLKLGALAPDEVSLRMTVTPLRPLM